MTVGDRGAGSGLTTAVLEEGSGRVWGADLERLVLGSVAPRVLAADLATSLPMTVGGRGWRDAGVGTSPVERFLASSVGSAFGLERTCFFEMDGGAVDSLPPGFFVTEGGVMDSLPPVAAQFSRSLDARLLESKIGFAGVSRLLAAVFGLMRPRFLTLRLFGGREWRESGYAGSWQKVSKESKSLVVSNRGEVGGCQVS